MSAQSNWIGQKVGDRYVIEALLGQGGMSAVYRATDPNLRRTVAVKLVHAHLTNDQEFVRRFETEAATVAQLRHPNIIQVFDFDHDGGTYYMVLEFVPGETLHTRLRRLNAANQRLPLNELLQVSINVAEALDYAHARGLIHRDVKPANIMINPQGSAVLMDFGIAKIMGSANQTATGTVIGTAQYISPEQVKGKRPTGQSDIYALGITLFEMAAGQPPFDGDSAMSIMLKHVNDAVPNLRVLSPTTPPDLIAIIERCLSKEPEKRFASGTDLADALRKVQTRLASGAPLYEPPPPQTQRPPPMATIMEPMPSAAPPGQMQRPPRPQPQPSYQAELPPTPQMMPNASASMADPPPPVFTYQPSAPAKPAAPPAPPRRERRGPSLSLLLGIPIIVFLCFGLVGASALAADYFGMVDLGLSLGAAAVTATPTRRPPTPTTPVEEQPTEAIATEAPQPTDVPPTEVVGPVVPEGMVLINGGAFNMGSTTGQADEQPLHPVALSSYFIDQFEVTNGRYLECVSETVCFPPSTPSSFTQPLYFGNPLYTNYPVVSITWEQAQKFCAWDGGKRLPTEAEWEYAATGGDNRPYPWGVEFNPAFTTANDGDTVAVGTYKDGVSPFGVFDMAGNVLEWVSDIYDSQFYAESVTDNPQGPEFGDERVLRGGSFGNTDGAVYTTTRRFHLPPTSAEVDAGFRCAMTVP